MDNSIEVINDLVLDLSLASALPVGADGRNFIRATAAAGSLAARTSVMDKKDLRSFEWTILPLLTLLKADVDHPVATKAAYGIRTLMPSRICMSKFLECEGLPTMGKVLDILLTKKSSEMRSKCEARNVVEHLAICYREIARFYPWEIVMAGGIRHCVLLLKFGDVALQTVA